MMISRLLSKRLLMSHHNVLSLRAGKRSLSTFHQLQLPTWTSSIHQNRHFGTQDEEDEPSSRKASTSASEWRKQQLDKLEQKFSKAEETDIQNIESDDDLQPMWSAMENRVRHRRPRTIEESGGKTGRVNVRKTDEDIWLQEGLYDGDDDSKKE